ncbi:hypothetical protein D7I46_12950 (plasmid) [Lactococcus allomyrinae]|uniref:Uncharacterized protein n=1 Tax=Lactococcus allomyrinae TaxID=2419773 RepID=A0A387BM05_9LACT|nr:hypothetical protein D7I46_12950 [Lactococcus allomyrinae]
MFFTWSVGFWLFLTMFNLIINGSNKNKKTFSWEKYWKLNFQVGGFIYFSYIVLGITRVIIATIILQ